MYYRLTYTASSDRGKVGDNILNGKKVLNIGQGLACNVQLHESEKYEPQIFATILPHNDGTGWFLMRRTDCHQVLVNGDEVPIAKKLENGDLISFEDHSICTELRFELFHDGDYDADSGIVYVKHKSNKRSIIVSAIIALFVLGLAIFFLSPHQKSLRHINLNQFNPSIYHITVDSVYLFCDTMIDGKNNLVKLEEIELNEVSAGTAFLAIVDNDTVFVTARHCVEPWINDEEWDGVSSKEKMSPEVRLATKAETLNRFAGYEKYVLRSHCVISKGFERYDYYSTDFYMNKSRDMVMRLGTDKEVLYWRTIFPIAHRRDMELGDFAYIKASNLTRADNGTVLSMTDWDEFKEYTKTQDRDIAVIGYPLNDNNADDLTVVYGNYAGGIIGDNMNSPDGCLQMSAPINRGNSGGPIIALTRNGVKVIGIVSKADGRANQGMFWAVPITEVIDMHTHGDKVDIDSVIYRR